VDAILVVIVVQDGKDMVDVLILEDVIVEDGDGGMDVGIKTNQLHHVANKYYTVTGGAGGEGGNGGRGQGYDGDKTNGIGGVLGALGTCATYTGTGTLPGLVILEKLAETVGIGDNLEEIRIVREMVLQQEGLLLDQIIL
jgi:hypothetical protein